MFPNNSNNTVFTLPNFANTTQPPSTTGAMQSFLPGAPAATTTATTMPGSTNSFSNLFAGTQPSTQSGGLTMPTAAAAALPSVGSFAPLSSNTTATPSASTTGAGFMMPSFTGANTSGSASTQPSTATPSATAGTGFMMPPLTTTAPSTSTSTSTQPPASSTGAAPTATPNFAALFGATPAPASTAPATSTTTNTPAPSGAASAAALFGATPAAVSTPAATNPLAGLTAAPASTPAPASLAANLFGNTASSSGTSSAAVSTPAPASSTSAAPSLNFGSTASTTAPASTTNSTTTAIANASSTTAAATAPSTSSTTAAAATSATTTAAASASTSSATSLTPATKAPSLAGKTIEQCVSEWAGELEKQLKTFTEQSQRVAKWDEELMANADRILQLINELDTAKRSQDVLNRTLEEVTTQQSELEEVIKNLEQQVFSGTTSMNAMDYGREKSDADKERERGYELASSINAQMDDMGNMLKTLVDRLNRMQERREADNELNVIVKILNAHLDTLNWLDRNVGDLESRVSVLKGQLTQQRKPNTDKRFGW